MMDQTLAAAAFRSYFRVRGTILGPLVFLGVMLVVEGSFWSMMAESGTLGAYDRTSLLVYMAAALVISQVTACTGEPDSLAAKIESGRLDSFLLRPTGFLGAMASVQIGTCLARMVTLLPLLFVGMAWMVGHLDAGAIIALVLLLPFAALLNFMINSAISTLSFALRDSYAFVVLKETLFWVLSGALIPLDFFPAWVQPLIAWFPPAYVVYFPSRIAMGLASVGDVLPRALALLGVATLLFLGAWRLGVRRYQAFGG